MTHPRVGVWLALVVAWLTPAALAAQDPLEAKAQHFRQAIVERHLSPEGLLLYRVNLETIEDDLVTGRYPHLADTPTFTGQLAATACTRANVTKGAQRQEALEDASQALDGLGLLMDVTGLRGLLARGVRRDDIPDLSALRGTWFRGAPGFSGYSWRGDVSMDQYANGLLPAVAACHDHFPERSRRLVADVASHLFAHDMHLVDPDGESTRYGNLSRTAGAGFNSIALLTGYAVFALAASLDPDPRWAQQRDLLRDRDRVVARARDTNLRILGITNYSNDLMAWNLYRVLVPLARRTGDPALVDLRHGMFRTWHRVKSDGNAYFTLVLCQIEPGACERPALMAAREMLERFPLDKTKRSLRPELAQLPRRWLPGRKRRPQARAPVPIELRPPSSFEWKSSPYRLDASVMPGWTYTGLDYLAAYWLYRSLDPSVGPPPKTPKGN
jgi:hypothetical protein